MRGAVALIVELVADIGLGPVRGDLDQEGRADRGLAAIGAGAVRGEDAGVVGGVHRQRCGRQRAAVDIGFRRGLEDVQPDRAGVEPDRDRGRILLGIGLDGDGADRRVRRLDAADGGIGDVGPGVARHRRADDGGAAAAVAGGRDDAGAERAGIGEARRGDLDLRRQRRRRQARVDAGAVDIGAGRPAHHIGDRVDHDGDAAARGERRDIGHDRLMRARDDGKAAHGILVLGLRSGVLSLGAWAAPRSKAWTSVPLLTESVSVVLVPSASTLVLAPLI